MSKPPRGRVCSEFDLATAKEIMQSAKSRIKPCPVCGADAWAGGNQHKMHHASVEKDHKRYPIRKVAHMLAGGRALRKGEVLSNTCEHAQCLGNLKPVRKAAIPIILTEQGKLHNAAHNAAKVAGRRRAGRVKVGMESAREIRASVAPRKEEAQKYGISEQMVSYIRTGKSYREVSPFSGLFGRAA